MKFKRRDRRLPATTLDECWRRPPARHMAAFTLVLQLGDNPDAYAVTVEAETLADAKLMGEAMFKRACAETGYVAIGRGEGDNVEWIGAFDYAPGAGPRWEAAD
jgi:hypothetical protein